MARGSRNRGWRRVAMGLAALATGLPGIAGARAVHSHGVGPACLHGAAVARQGISPRPDPQRAAFASAIEKTFYWMRQFSKPTLPVCAFRAGEGLPIPLCCRDSLRLISKRMGIPLWVLERLNPGHSDSIFRHRHRVRLPAVTESIRKWCFLPVRRWRDELMPEEAPGPAPARRLRARDRAAPRVVEAGRPGAARTSHRSG